MRIWMAISKVYDEKLSISKQILSIHFANLENIFGLIGNPSESNLDAFLYSSFFLNFGILFYFAEQLSSLSITVSISWI